jgi:hypothetical protein
MNNEHMHAGFARNRRFLIAVSLALACVSVLGLRFTELTILGNTAPIDHPEYVTPLAWIVWAWAFAQYIVWYRDVGAWREFLQAVVDDCEQRLGRKVASEPIPQWVEVDLRSNLGPSLPASQDRSTIRVVAEFARMHGDGVRVVRAADIEASAYARLPEQRGEARAGPIRFEREIGAGEWRKHMVGGAVRVFLTRRFTLEYFAPYLIGAMPLAVWFWHRTGGH